MKRDNRQELRRLDKEWQDKWEEKLEYLKSIGINIFSPTITPDWKNNITKEQKEQIKYFNKEMDEINKKIKLTKDDQDLLLDKIKESNNHRPKRENQRVFFLWIIWIDEDGDPYWRYHSTWETLKEAIEEREYVMNDYTVKITEKAITPSKMYFKKTFKKGIEYDDKENDQKENDFEWY